MWQERKETSGLLAVTTTPNGTGVAQNGKHPVGREDQGRGAWRYINSCSLAVSIGALANGGPVHVEANGEPVLVEGNGDTVETNEDAVGSTNGEREPEPVCTGVSRGG